MSAAADGHGGWVLGVDSGGSGLRCALAPAHGQGPPAARAASERPVRTGPGGLDAEDLIARLRPMLAELTARAGAGRIRCAAIGAAGMASLGERVRAVVPGWLADGFGTERLALAADAVTAYAGALGLRPGAVVAAGTGLIALGTGPGITGWRRADGWGHLLGDCGGGAWIGRAGLEAALRAHDGRAGGSRALLARMEAVFGPAERLPGLLYPRSDRAAVLASFAPEVARCAADDPVAAGILREAARHILQTAAAVRPEGPAPVALTGGLLRLGEPLTAPLYAQAPGILGETALVAAEGDPLDGALRIATALADGMLELPQDGALLTLHGPPPPGSPVS